MWERMTLGELCNIELGKTPSRSNKKLWDENKTSDNVWLSIADLPQEVMPVLVDSKEYVSNEGALLCKVVPKGTLMVSFKLSLGRLAFAGCDLFTNEAIAALPILDESIINKHYLYWYLTYFDWDKAAGNDVKVKGKTLNKSKLKLLEVAVPPLSTQKDIVEKLTDVMAGIEKAKQNAEQSLKNARELFDSYLQNVLSQKDGGWQETTVGNEVELLTGNAFKSKDYVSDADSVKLLRGDNIMQGYFRWDDAKYWPNSRVNEFEKFLLKEGDIVLAMDRTWVKAGMKFAQITANELPCLLLQRVARLRCKQGMNKDLLYFLMGSKLFESYVLSIQTGLGVPHISGKQIQSFSFNKPNMEEQGVIADKLKTLSTEIEKLKSIYAQKVETLNELKQSILQKAFTGEL